MNSSDVIISLDAIYLKGFKLLFSKDKNAVDDLRKLAMTVATSKGAEKLKRGAEKIESSTIKKSRIESPASSNSDTNSEATAASLDAKAASEEVSGKSSPSSDRAMALRSSDESNASDSEKADEELDADDFALGMGLICVVCKSFELSSGNQLMECSDCGSLYHQQCHNPAVPDEDRDDPRLVWRCAKCTALIKKNVGKSSKVKPYTKDKLREFPDSRSKGDSHGSYKQSKTYESSSSSSKPLSAWASQVKSSKLDSEHRKLSKPDNPFPSLTSKISGADKKTYKKSVLKSDKK